MKSRPRQITREYWQEGPKKKLTMTDAALAQRRANVEAIAARKRARTHCKRGHEFTPENTYISSGTRHCKRCHLDGNNLRRNMGMTIAEWES